MREPDPALHTGQNNHLPARRELRQASAPSSLRARRRRRLAITVSLISMLVLGGVAAAWIGITSTPNAIPGAALSPTPVSPSTRTPAPTLTPTPTLPPEPSWNIDDPASIQVVINKQRQIEPSDWQPNDLVQPDVPNSSGQPLRAEAAAALETMHAEAQASGVSFALVSGFRSYDLQAQLFSNYSAADGIEAAETYSARPAHSEHQTGLAADISECLGCALSTDFGGTAAGAWARDNAHRFGFILRYNDGEQPIVGYMYEPWHFRYVGAEIAGDMHARSIKNLEDYFGLPPAPNYG